MYLDTNSSVSIFNRQIRSQLIRFISFFAEMHRRVNTLCGPIASVFSQSLNGDVDQNNPCTHCIFYPFQVSCLSTVFLGLVW